MVGVVQANLLQGDAGYLGLKRYNGGYDFIQGQFIYVLAEEDPAWEDFREKGFSSYLKPAQAIVADSTDSRVMRDAIHQLIIGQEPSRPYYVIMEPQAYVGMLKTAILKAEEEARKRELTNEITQLSTLLDYATSQGTQSLVQALPYLDAIIGLGVAITLSAAGHNNWNKKNR